MNNPTNSNRLKQNKLIQLIIKLIKYNFSSSNYKKELSQLKNNILKLNRRTPPRDITTMATKTLLHLPNIINVTTDTFNILCILYESYYIIIKSAMKNNLVLMSNIVVGILSFLFIGVRLLFLL